MSYNEAEVAALVRQVVSRTLGQERVQRPILDEQTVRQLPAGSQYTVAPGTLVTPLARQIALERRISIVDESEEAAGQPVVVTNKAGQRIVALGADHGGYALKEQLKHFVAEAGYAVMDCGAHSGDAVDYPDFAYAVARLVANGQAWRGIMIDGAGIGSCMVANKVPGVRAAMCYDQATAVNSREHNNANVLTLGAGLIGPNLARQIVQSWLATDFGGGRHARRVNKIDAVGNRFMKKPVE